MYAKIPHCDQQSTLNSHHHIYLDSEFRQDCQMWLAFLQDVPDMVKYCRPFVDMAETVVATELGFHTDSSTSKILGFGGVCQQQWFYSRWEKGYIKLYKPSIAYLELYAVCVGIYIWSDKFRNSRVVLHCDNSSVMQMVNNTTSGCPKCMHLVRMLVLRGLEYNFRIFARYISTKSNDLVDSLSRFQLLRFRNLVKGKNFRLTPERLLHQLWPASKIWDGFDMFS